MGGEGVGNQRGRGGREGWEERGGGGRKGKGRRGEWREGKGGDPQGLVYTPFCVRNPEKYPAIATDVSDVSVSCAKTDERSRCRLGTAGSCGQRNLVGPDIPLGRGTFEGSWTWVLFLKPNPT